MTKLEIVAIALTVIAASAEARDISVDGPSSGIQAAIDSASNGDVIRVASGTYLENIDFKGKLLTLKSLAGAGETIIDGSGGTAVRISGAATIEGFTITGGYGDYGAGVNVSGSGTVIAKNIFQFNTQAAGGFGAAIGGNGASPIIDGNIFRNNNADSQFLSGVVSLVNVSSPVIVNNLFYQNAARAINFTVPQEAQPFVANNTIVGNTSGIYIDGRIGFSPDIIVNNIVVGNGIGFESSFAGSVAPAVFSYNLVADNGTDFSGLPDFVGIDGNFVADPLFLDAAGHDYHLAVGSPALAAGNPAYASAHDFDGNIRSTTSPSIGAFELAIPVPEASTQSLFSVGMAAVVGLGRWREKRRPLGR